MAKVEFCYKQNIIQILCYQNEIMEDICNRFALKINMNINDLIFLYSGIKLDIKLPFSQIINNTDKERNIMSIVVNKIDLENFSEDSVIKPMFPICSICSEKAILEVENFKFKIYGCKNGHIINNILLNEFDKTQTIDISKIKCDNCQTKKIETFNNEMHICNICKLQLCPLCKQKHDKNHILIKDENKNYYCEIHNELYVSYCKTCNENICMKCEKKTFET